jgi:prepilin signal peptidase PulO-like enzyme (type II secretory pathway)
MGLGDVKAMFAIGAAFGPLESLIAIFGACASGILAAAVTRRLRPGESVRFGPHLAAGSALALSLGDPIVRFITRP